MDCHPPDIHSCVYHHLGVPLPPRRSPRDSCRRYAICGPAFTWSPARESRAAIWKQIKAHGQAELDRIWAQHLLEGRVARRQAAPTYDRNRQLFRDHQHGASETELGRTYWHDQHLRSGPVIGATM